MQQPIYIRHLRIFDGLRIIPASSILLRDGVIVAVSDDIPVPEDAQVIDGSGQTLLPGLIDAHTHIYGSGLEPALMFGVTTELDMFADHHLIADLKQQEAADQSTDRADLRSAGTAITAPGGHGTEYGIPIPTITGPREAQDFVDARIAEGSDYIKIIYDDGSAYGRKIPTISKATLAAIVEAAHRRGKIAVVHVLALQAARAAIEVGVDGLAHLFADRYPDPAFARLAADHHTFVIPTLTILEAMCGIAGGATLVADPDIAPYLTKSLRDNLHSVFGIASPRLRYTVAEETIRQLQSAGVSILAGTDAPSPGTAHGASLHRELELLVQAGLTPLEALIAVTSAPATVFDLLDRGRIAPGLRADLVLVQGDPTTEIKATRAIVGIWKRGVPVDRQAYRVQVEQERRELAGRTGPVGSESGLVSDFEDGTMSTHFGLDWQSIADSVNGGRSTAQCKGVPEGANGGKGSLLITGKLAFQPLVSWAGAIFYPGTTPAGSADLSEKKGLAFWAKGDGKRCNVTIFADRFSARPASVSFVAGPEWKHYNFSFARFGRFNSHTVLGILFGRVFVPGSFSLQIDDVRFTS